MTKRSALPKLRFITLMLCIAASNGPAPSTIIAGVGINSG